MRVYRDEWSGVLFYKVLETFHDSKLPSKVLCTEMFLEDIGNPVYTEFVNSPEFFEFMMDRPDLMEQSSGLIHSHNNMGVFFSGTDSDELYSNSVNHNHYLSLIVNNKLEATAKVATRVTGFERYRSHYTAYFPDGKGSVHTSRTTYLEDKELDGFCPDLYIQPAEVFWSLDVDAHTDRLNKLCTDINYGEKVKTQHVVEEPIGGSDDDFFSFLIKHEHE